MISPLIVLKKKKGALSSPFPKNSAAVRIVRSSLNPLSAHLRPNRGSVLRRFLLTQNGPAPCRCGANVVLLLCLSDCFNDNFRYLINELFIFFLFKGICLNGINAFN